MSAKRKRSSPALSISPTTSPSSSKQSPAVKVEGPTEAALISAWPAPVDQITSARDFIQRAAEAQCRTLLVPDKDADGLSAGVIMRHTLLSLGLPPDKIDVHFVTKGSNVHEPAEQELLASYKPDVVIVLDQGSRPGEPLVPGAETLIIDHHFVGENGFPRDAKFVTASNSPPVATSALLTYHICEPLHEHVRSKCAWLCIVGTQGDLGNTLKWETPFPDMAQEFKQHTKKVLNDVVSLVNAPRRTATYDVASAWRALSDTADPRSVLTDSRLRAARQEVNAEVERCTHAAPIFSADGRVAVFRIRSAAQVHPVIATRWAGHLQSKALEIVLVANEGYLPAKVNFSCRIPRCARAREPPVDIIASLRAYASRTESKSVVDGDGDVKETMSNANVDRRPLLERLGENFARGHVQASGGIVGIDEFEELMRLMEIGVKPPKKSGEESSSSPSKKKKAGIDPKQKNTLMEYLQKSTKSQQVPS